MGLFDFIRNRDKTDEDKKFDLKKLQETARLRLEKKDFKPGDPVVQITYPSPYQFPAEGVIAIVLEMLPPERQVVQRIGDDDATSACAQSLADVRILIQDPNGNNVDYIMPSTLLRIATPEEIAAADGKDLRKPCPGCGKVHDDPSTHVPEHLIELMQQLGEKLGGMAIPLFGDLDEIDIPKDHPLYDVVLTRKLGAFMAQRAKEIFQQTGAVHDPENIFKHVLLSEVPDELKDKFVEIRSKIVGDVAKDVTPSDGPTIH